MKDAAKGPGGRPTHYMQEYCQAVEDFMAEGYSKLAAAGKIGVCYMTIRNWMDAYPEFFEAVKRGEAKRAVKLEFDLLEAKTGPKVTSRIFALKNAAPDEWKDKQAHEVSGPDGGPIQTSITADDAFARLASRLDGIAPGAQGGADGAE